MLPIPITKRQTHLNRNHPILRLIIKTGSRSTHDFSPTRANTFKKKPSIEYQTHDFTIKHAPNSNYQTHLNRNNPILHLILLSGSRLVATCVVTFKKKPSIKYPLFFGQYGTLPFNHIYSSLSDIVRFNNDCSNHSIMILLSLLNLHLKKKIF